MTFKALLISTALLMAILTVPSALLSAQSSCQSGESDISSPVNNYTIPATLLVQAAASTGGGCDITALRLYVDHVGVYTAPEGGSPSAGFQKSTTFTQGYHRLVVVAWNNEGYAFSSPSVTIFAAPKDATVYITSPSSTQSVSGTVTIAARARWDNNFIQAMRAYVDNQAVYTADHPTYGAISFQKVFSPGTHHLTVVAWNGADNQIVASENFTVK